jgi:hypothetical protein
MQGGSKEIRGGRSCALINNCGGLCEFVRTWLVGRLQALTGNSRATHFVMFMSIGVYLSQSYRL